MGGELTMVGASTAAEGNTPFLHDVFVSYSHKDRAWVREQLVPDLTGAGLKVLADWDFDIGQPSVANMTKAVRDSRYVVAVLTQNWVESEWSGFEGYLITTADPIGQRRRLLPLMLEPCKPPPHISFLTYADFTQPAQRAEEMKRLLRAMQAHDEVSQALPVRTTYASDYARDGLAALVDLIRTPEVRDTVVGFKTVFGDTRQQAEVLYNYKDLHDQLHDMQVRCYYPLLQEMSTFPENEETVEHLTDGKLTLEADIDNAREIIGRADYLSNETPGLVALEQALAVLDEAITKRDPVLLQKAAEKLERVMALRPSRINGKLVSAAEHLHLGDLVKAMKVISDRLEAAGANKGKLQQFVNGVRGLEVLHAALRTLIEEHDLWQQVDNTFQQIESDLDKDFASFAEAWTDLHQLAAPLYAKKLEPWAERYRLLEENLLNAIRQNNPGEARKNFRLLRGRARDRFFRVDDTLKRSCENLRKIGEPLAAVLEVL